MTKAEQIASEDFERRILERALNKDGTQLVMLSCGHIVTMIIPLPHTQKTLICLQCVNTFVDEKKRENHEGPIQEK